MRKTFCLMLLVIMCCMLTIPAMAASEEPVITLQPQSPNYPEYSVAIYTVKAEGTNLQATWYMEWLGKIYTISDIGGAMQDWEPYAGESYGARKLDDNTFAFIFEGIEYDLDGAYIWCVIEDGHYNKRQVCGKAIIISRKRIIDGQRQPAASHGSSRFIGDSERADFYTYDKSDNYGL